jgi:hypothetical protein
MRFFDKFKLEATPARPRAVGVAKRDNPICLEPTLFDAVGITPLRTVAGAHTASRIRPFTFRVNKLPMSAVLEGRVAPDMVALVRCPMARRTGKRGGEHVE